MEIYKLAQLSLKIGGTFKNKRPGFFYQEFKSNLFFKKAESTSALAILIGPVPLFQFPSSSLDPFIRT